MADVVSKGDSFYEPVKKVRRKHKRRDSNKDNEAKLNLERQMREEKEKKKREILLLEVSLLFKKVKAKGINSTIKDEELKEWKRYTTCNNLPYPDVPTSVRKHFLTWCHEEKYADIEQINKSMNLYLPIFNIIKQIADIPIKAYTNVIKSIQEIVVEWKREFIEKIDYACFLLIKDIRKYFSHLDFYTREYHKTFDNFKLGMWSLLDVPMKLDFVLELPVITFPNIEVTVKLPFPYNKKPFVLRVIYTTFDFFSDLTKTSHKPEFNKMPDLLSEVKRYEELKESVQLELEEIKKEKLRQLELERQKKEMQDDDIFRQTEDLEIKLSRRSTATSMLSSVCHWSRADSSTSHFSILSAQKSRSVLLGHIKNDSKSSFPYMEMKKLPLWETKSDPDIKSRYSISTFTSKVRTSNVLNVQENNCVDKINIMNDGVRWSCADLELLVTKDSDIDMAKSFSFFDFIFHLYSNEQLEILPAERTIQELVRQHNVLYQNKTIDVNQEIKPFFDIVSKREEERYDEFVEQMTAKTRPYEVNLRKFHTFSGIYCVDLIKHAYDLSQMQLGNFLQMQIGPYKLEKEDFIIQMKKHLSESSINTFEIKLEDYYFQLDENMEIGNIEHQKASKIDGDEIDFDEYEKNDEKLIVIKIFLPKDVFWFMKPQPAIWDNEKQLWSVEHVYEVEYNRQNVMIQFKLGKVGPIAMFTIRFHELPYKNWSLSPNDDGSVNLTLEGQHLTIEFQIAQDKICLNSITGYSKNLLDGIIGKMVSINELIDQMKSLGLDVFPEDDTFLYVNGCSAKPAALEDHTYFTMSMFSNTLQFTSSKWNLSVGRNDIVFQSRLNSPYSPLPFRTYKANNFRCEIVPTDGDAQKFPESTFRGKDFYPDPYTLLSKLYSRNVHFLQSDSTKVYTVYRLLLRTKVLTFSGEPSNCL